MSSSGASAQAAVASSLPSPASSLFGSGSVVGTGKHQSRHVKREASDGSALEGLGEGCVVSIHRPLLACNTQVLAQLLDDSRADTVEAVASIASINNTILRRHFAELTEQFLSPFNKYFVAMEKSQDAVEKLNPYLYPPVLPPFREQEFLDEISSRENLQLLKFNDQRAASITKLYQRFFRAPHFYPWFNSCREQAQLTVDRRIERMIKKTDMRALMDGMRVRQAVQMYEIVHHHIQKYAVLESPTPFQIELTEILKSHRQTIYNALPDNVRPSISVSVSLKLPRGKYKNSPRPSSLNSNSSPSHTPNSTPPSSPSMASFSIARSDSENKSDDVPVFGRRPQLGQHVVDNYY
eukprot:TRINITY_DN5869_c0_g1_i6.p1 TRINITY_DN5869_c0_g1~~TRINITY_DN5869_c0_g1_i6.p1  ORF type:complete len:394 (-),score=69.54 TRINITY_DN5869_c0_g1_i6:63-1118(-)